MARETEIRTGRYPPYEAWPPDDSEESVVGTDLYQTTITNLRWGINEAARLRAGSGQPVPWRALSQIVLLGCVRRDGTAYRTLPDVFVYPHPVGPNRSSFALGLDGPPVLIVEVLSESTYDSDLDLQRGKAYSYAQAGVREYLALDPTGAFLSERGRAWRLAEGRYRPWEPDADGRWQSGEIAVGFGLDGVLATVYTREGKAMLREGEVEEELGRRDEAISRQAAEIEALRRQLRELRGEA